MKDSFFIQCVVPMIIIAVVACLIAFGIAKLSQFLFSS